MNWRCGEPQAVDNKARRYTRLRFDETRCRIGLQATPTMTLAGGRPVTALHICLVGALARTGSIALAIVALGAPGLHAERLPIQTYNTSNGLAHDRIRCIVPDSRGFLWFCTADGLSRFDGSRFVNYGPEQGLPNPSVEEIVEGGPGVYWVATLGGLARLRIGLHSLAGRQRRCAERLRTSAGFGDAFPHGLHAGLRRSSQYGLQIAQGSRRSSVDRYLQAACSSSNSRMGSRHFVVSI